MAIELKNINKFGGGGVTDCWWGLWTSSGYMTGTTALASGEDSAMGRISIPSNVGFTVPNLPARPNTGDRGTVAGTYSSVNASPETLFTKMIYDLALVAATTTSKIVSQGPHNLMIDPLNCEVREGIFVVINEHAISYDSDTYLRRGYTVHELLFGFPEFVDGGAITRETETESSMRLLHSSWSTTPWGESFDDTTWGGEITWRMKPYFSEYPVTYHSFSGDGVTSSITLAVTPASEDGDAVQSWTDASDLTYTTDYTTTASTKAVDFVDVPAEGEFNVSKILYLKTC